MLLTNVRLDKLAAAHSNFTVKGMMQGTALLYTAMLLCGEQPHPLAIVKEEDHDDHGAIIGPKMLSSIELAVTIDTSLVIVILKMILICIFLEREYPKYLTELAANIDQPNLPALVCCFLYDQLNPDGDAHSDKLSLNECTYYNEHIFIYHSAIARFYAPSNLCGAGGMYHEHIRSLPAWQGEYAHHDTVFIETDLNIPGMLSMCVGHVLLFFSFMHEGQYYPYALVHWFVPVGSAIDDETGF
jgi:hypothetical protein